MLAKTARKQEVWDVCRAACRFCLSFDSKRSKSSKTNSKIMNRGETANICVQPRKIKINNTDESFSSVIIPRCLNDIPHFLE